jgi:hypothetical protein
MTGNGVRYDLYFSGFGFDNNAMASSLLLPINVAINS